MLMASFQVAKGASPIRLAKYLHESPNKSFFLSHGKVDHLARQSLTFRRQDRGYHELSEKNGKVDLVIIL
jgi:hypothetical protein